MQDRQYKALAIFVFDNKDNALRNALESQGSSKSWDGLKSSIGSDGGKLTFFQLEGQPPGISEPIGKDFHHLSFRFNLEVWRTELSEQDIRNYAAEMIGYPMVLMDKSVGYTFTHVG